MKTYPILIMSLALAAGFLTIQSGNSASPAWTNNDVVWGGATNSGYYRPGISTGTNDAYDGLPNDAAQTTPVWVLGASQGTATLDATNNFLNITTTGAEQRRYDQSNYWDASTAATVEFTTRINSMQSGAIYAGTILVGNTSEFYSISLGITNTWLNIQGTEITGVVATNFNTIRLTLNDMGSAATSKINVYVNNSTTAAVTFTNLAAGSVNLVRFGDLSTGGTQGGSVDWQSVQWLSGQAIAPIPEPASAALLLGGLGLLTGYLGLRRRGRADSRGK